MSGGISGGKQVIKFANRSNRGRVCLFYQNNTTVPFIIYHYLLLSLKVLHFLLSRINKIDRDFLDWQLLLPLCPLRNYMILLLSDQSISTCKDDGYRE